MRIGGSPISSRAWDDAVRRGSAEDVAWMLDGGADIDALDRHGQTALMRAALHGHLELVRLLVSRGAALNQTAKYRLSALMLAAVNGRTEIARVLVEAGADRSLCGSGAPGFAGKTALDLARDRKDGALAEILTSAGDD